MGVPVIHINVMTAKLRKLLIDRRYRTKHRCQWKVPVRSPMPLSTYTIYALVDPQTREVRYVGQTRQKLEVRLENHMLCARKDYPYPVYDWIRSLAPAKPIPVVLQRIEESTHVYDPKREHKAHTAEVEWMKRFERFQLLQFVDKKRRAY